MSKHGNSTSTASLWVVLVLCFCLYSYVVDGKAFTKRRTTPLKRPHRSVPDATRIGCIHMESFSGEYEYESTGGSMVCGLYLIGLSNQLVEVEFLDFNIGCEVGGLLATLDGWETRGEIFPSDTDHALSMDDRYKVFCGPDSPKRVLVTSQNVALIQFRVPVSRQGFRVAVRFINNPKPCNAVSLESQGVYTLQNYGQMRNCSVSFLYPESFRVLSLDVDTTEMGQTNPHVDRGNAMVKCAKRDMASYVEFMGGAGLDTSIMAVALDVCGMDSMPDFPSVMIGCSHSVVRLVSTDNRYNSVSFMYRPIDDINQPSIFKRCHVEE